nr:MAG TPA: hypothetical protein [Caudoviricetes sp.]
MSKRFNSRHLLTTSCFNSTKVRLNTAKIDIILEFATI